MTIKLLILGLTLAFLTTGCRAVIKPPEERPGVIYQVTEGAQISKVSMYMKVTEGVPRCWVDVTVKNLTDASAKFKVVVKVDDEPGIAVTSKKPIDPKKEDTMSVMTLGKSLPRTVSLTVLK
ncbi:MAG: hypothetical protein HY882_00805 [Deltaproteobacteria bacterium]|nr:hypothetical protein [Deltaproteobacteria bacterium]